MSIPAIADPAALQDSGSRSASAGHGPASEQAFLQSWLEHHCVSAPGARHGALVLGAPDVGPFVPEALWPPGQGVTPLLAEVAERTLHERSEQRVHGIPHSVVSLPVDFDGQLHGLVAVETSVQQESALQQIQEQLRWGLFAIESILSKREAVHEQTTRERLIATLDLVASVLSEETFEAAAQALATDLAIRLDCDRVSIGFVRNGHTAIVAVSHSAEFGQRMNLMRSIGTAMDEALDQKSPISLPVRGEEILVVRDHLALARAYGSDSLLTVPFSATAGAQGAFLFERPANRPFEDSTVELCQAVVALGARILEEKRLNGRLLVTRVRDAVRDELSRFLGPRYFGRKLAALLLMVAAVFFSFATGNYRVGATAALEGSVRRVLVAPFDGYVATATHRAGDVVRSGTVLATMDDRDLRLEYLKWASQRTQYTKQVQEAVAQRERAQGGIVQSQVQQAEAQMNLLGEQLARTKVTAPFDGLVVSGDLSQSLGGSVKRGQVLFEVSPLNSYRVVLEVDEGEVSAIQEKQKGTLLLTSIPGEEFAFTVTRLTPIAASKDGRSFFRVEGLLARNSERLRPGMEGVAKVEVGQRKLFWIATHKLADWLRLSVWAWL